MRERKCAMCGYQSLRGYPASQTVCEYCKAALRRGEAEWRRAGFHCAGCDGHDTDLGREGGGI